MRGRLPEVLAGIELADSWRFIESTSRYGADDLFRFGTEAATS